MTKKKERQGQEPLVRYQMRLVSRAGAPSVTGVEFIVGPLDPEITVLEFMQAMEEFRRNGIPDDQLVISATTGDDSFTVLMIAPSVGASDWREPITPQIPRRTVRAISRQKGS